MGKNDDWDDKEQQRQRRHVKDRQYAEEGSSSKSRNVFGIAFSCALLGAAGYLTWKYALDEPTNLEELKDGIGNVFDTARDKWNEWDLANFTNVLDDLDDFSFGDLFDDDPKLGDNSTLVWDKDYVRPNDGGLHLTLRNALDDTWQNEFADAVRDWQESDALVLAPERVAVDHTCERIDGVMVVCNANFGATGWVGINENQIIGGRIVSSVAKMNEYYLRNGGYDHRRFTMCHEIGHGLGLPHTDEDPYNRNLGDCLDYTDDPEQNVLPGEVNMAKLREMYLTRRRRRVQEDGNVMETTRLVRR